MRLKRWVTAGLFCALMPVGVFAMHESRLMTGAATESSCSSAVLHLLPGVRKPDGTLKKEFKIASTISHLPFYAAFPLYQGARPTQKTGDPWYTFGLTPYAETAVARYLVPGDPNSLLKWYDSRMVACGYLLKGGGENEHHKTVIAAGSMFTAPSISPDFQATVSLQAADGTTSILVIYASTVDRPTRPSSSYMPAFPKSVTIHLIQPSGESQLIVSISNRSAVDGLDQAFSLPALEDVGTNNCLPGPGWANLTFRLVNNKTMRATASPGCFDFSENGSHRISDPDLGVWNAVRATVFNYCRGHACKPRSYHE